MFSFMYTSDVCEHKEHSVVQNRPKKLSSKLLLISSPNIDGFYRFFHCLTQQTIL